MIDLFNLPDDFDWFNDWNLIEFIDTVQIVDLTRGRSAAHFVAVSMTRATVRYIIFMVDLLDMLPQIVERKISGIFKVSKYGNNFGIRLKDIMKTPRVRWHDRNLIIPEYI